MLKPKGWMRAATLGGLVLIIAPAVSTCLAASGDLLIQYDSALGTLPAQQGWAHDGMCLRTRCPANALPPPHPSHVNECFFQGLNGNDCTMQNGCGPDDGDGGHNEHFNAVPYSVPPSYLYPCTHTEWLAFDDGQDYLDQPVPVGLPYRNLTFPPEPSLISWGPHEHPAFGAVWFLNAPNHPPLRIVCGGGVPGITLPAGSDNNRNVGRIRLTRQYTLRPEVTSVTLVAKIACGNREPQNELILFTAMGRRFALGVDGRDGSTTLGRFSWGTNSSTEMNIFPGQTVQVAVARKGSPGPHEGEFFIVRITLQNTGAVQVWLNENPSNLWTTTTGTGLDNSVIINPDSQSSTMWVDYVRLLEGEVPPPGCADPRFDVNRDGRVNSLDRYNETDGFLDCATGPASPPEVLEAMPERCQCHDANGDGAVDMIDFAAFQRCLTLGNAPLDPACDD